jgi:hypothetical protein
VNSLIHTLKNERLALGIPTFGDGAFGDVLGDFPKRIPSSKDI